MKVTGLLAGGSPGIWEFWASGFVGLEVRVLGFWGGGGGGGAFLGLGDFFGFRDHQGMLGPQGPEPTKPKALNEGEYRGLNTLEP